MLKAALSTAALGDDFDDCLAVAKQAGWTRLELDLRRRALGTHSGKRLKILPPFVVRRGAGLGLKKKGFEIASVLLEVDDASAASIDRLARDVRRPLDEVQPRWFVVAFRDQTMPPLAELPEARDALRRIGDLAVEKAATLCLETQPPWCGHYRDMAATIACLNHPAWKLNFDTGLYQLYNLESVGEVALQRVLGLVGSLRITDLDTSDHNAGAPWTPPEVPRYAPLGQGGCLDLGRLRQILDAVCFAGVWSVSFSAQSTAQFQRALEHSTRALRAAGFFEPRG
jgi:sugar phosphate isomerase/epimerase